MKRAKAMVKGKVEEGYDAKQADAAALQRVATFLYENIEFLLMEKPRPSAMDAEIKKFTNDYSNFRGRFHRVIVVCQMRELVQLEEKLRIKSSSLSTSEYYSLLKVHADSIVTALREPRYSLALKELNAAIKLFQKSTVVQSMVLEYKDFFLAPFEHTDRYKNLFHDHTEFNRLNTAFRDSFTLSDAKSKKGIADKSAAEQYEEALQGFPLPSQLVEIPGAGVVAPGLKQGSLRLLSLFFGRNGIVLNFLYTQKTSIEALAKIYERSLIPAEIDRGEADEGPPTQPSTPPLEDSASPTGLEQADDKTAAAEPLQLLSEEKRKTAARPFYAFHHRVEKDPKEQTVDNKGEQPQTTSRPSAKRKRAVSSRFVGGDNGKGEETSQVVELGKQGKTHAGGPRSSRSHSFS